MQHHFIWKSATRGNEGDDDTAGFDDKVSVPSVPSISINNKIFEEHHNDDDQRQDNILDLNQVLTSILILSLINIANDGSSGNEESKDDCNKINDDRLSKNESRFLLSKRYTDKSNFQFINKDDGFMYGACNCGADNGEFMYDITKGGKHERHKTEGRRKRVSFSLNGGIIGPVSDGKNNTTCGMFQQQRQRQHCCRRWSADDASFTAADGTTLHHRLDSSPKIYARRPSF